MFFIVPPKRPQMWRWCCCSADDDDVWLFLKGPHDVISSSRKKSPGRCLFLTISGPGIMQLTVSLLFPLPAEPFHRPLSLFCNQRLVSRSLSQLYRHRRSTADVIHPHTPRHKTSQPVRSSVRLSKRTAQSEDEYSWNFWADKVERHYFSWHHRKISTTN